MRWSRFAIFILAVTTVQASIILDWLAVTNLNIKPDLLLILVVFFAVRCRRYDAIIISFAAGLAADLIGPPMGPHIISFGLFGSLLAHLRSLVIINNMFHQVTTIFFTGLAIESLARFLASLTGQPMTVNAGGLIFGTALYSAVIWFFLGWFFSASLRWMGIKKHRFGTIHR
jgi:rod shape-determining protein MreD